MSDDFEPLEKLIRLFREKGPVVKIGIFENTARYAKDTGDAGEVADLGNADVGAIHEFGGGHVPQRSFLRMPMETQFPKFLKKAGIGEKELKKAIKAGTQDALAEGIAEASMACVEAGFDSGGFGLWPPHSPNYKTGGNLLKDTGQLKASISTKVEKKA
jgi:phage gpG-like protein